MSAGKSIFQAISGPPGQGKHKKVHLLFRMTDLLEKLMSPRIYYFKSNARMFLCPMYCTIQRTLIPFCYRFISPRIDLWLLIFGPNFNYYSLYYKNRQFYNDVL